MKRKNFKHSFWKNRPTLVTGGTGFIGSWLASELLNRGAKTIILDVNPSSPILDLLNKKLIIIPGDVCNYNLVAEIIKKYNIDTIFHLAAQAEVTAAYKNPLLTLKINISGTYNILENSRQSKTVRKIIIASSDKAYGEHTTLPYREDAPLKGIYPYDTSKSCADLIAQMYFKTYNLPICITRCGNVFGGGDLRFSRLIPYIIRTAFYNQKLLIRSDGTFRRDYIYVKDIVAAYIRLAEEMEREEIIGEVFNFGDNNPRSVIEVVQTVLSLMRKGNLEIQILNQAPYEIKNQYLFSEKAERLLGWKPQYKFEEGLKETIVWYTAYFSYLKNIKGQ